MYHIGNGCVTMEEPFSGFVRDTNDTPRTGRVLTAWFTVNSLYDKGTAGINHTLTSVTKISKAHFSGSLCIIL